ncbi:hypothetical protein ACE41H_21370 [Paenibacillus enshidis]|uniref:Uncharacterized protein n=1 Tax=Paenibacillus enshidis TaxID=1458439 RepID=A0ABV5AYN8_9BACL
MMYEVGALFPQLNPEPGVAVPRTQIVGSSFDVTYYINKPTNKEINTFKNSLLRLHIFVYKHIPFMAISYLGSSWTYDFTLTVVGRDKEVLDTFFHDGNAVNLFLIDDKTNILRAGRLIGLYPEAEHQIKSACRDQLTAYKEIAEVNAVINEGYSSMQTDDIIHSSTTYEFQKNY